MQHNYHDWDRGSYTGDQHRTRRTENVTAVSDRRLGHTLGGNTMNIDRKYAVCWSNIIFLDGRWQSGVGYTTFHRPSENRRHRPFLVASKHLELCRA